ncbi:MAG: UDP-N-acetylmuramate dehydrogenase [Alphaproteobacteria bacterium]|nr:UDP-N-acetylmuramate dehydrogenase [Alphaproteobacteria bacterium]
MSAAASGADSVIARLPKVRGTYQPRAMLKDLTWFRAGGPADVLFWPTDTDDLATFLRGVPDDVPITIVGVGSNLLVRDGGIEGVVIRLGRGFSQVTPEGANRVRAGAAALDVAVAKGALDAGLSGLEFMRGIPGTVGGGLKMNAGAYGREFKDVLVEAVALDRRGERVVYGNAQMGFTYRHSSAPADLVFVEAVFEGAPGEKAAIETRMNEITEARSATQPIKSRTGGSTFKNPPGHKAWQLIDQAGCRGLRRGDAEVSTLHCNFLINHGAATGDDIEALGEEVRAKVKAASGVELEWEIKRIGRFGGQS